MQNITSAKQTPQEKIKSLIGGLTNKEKNIILFAFLMLVIIAIFYYISTLNSSTTVVIRSSAAAKCGYSSNYSKCIETIAIQSDNTTTCNSTLAGNTKINCIYNVALKNNNITQCNELNSSYNYSINCKLAVINKTKNYSACSSIQQPYSSFCLYAASKSENFSNLSACSKIQNKTDAITCNNLYYLNLAIKNKSANDCSYLSNTTSFSDILTLINYNSSSNTLQQNINNITSTSYFSQINFTNYQMFLNSTPRDYCYYKLAEIENNSSTCNSIISNIYRNECLYKLTPHQPPPLININYNASNATLACKNNTNTIIKSCYILYNFHNAIESENVIGCNIFGNSSAGSICVMSIALKELNTSTCNSVYNTTLRGICSNTINILKIYRIPQNITNTTNFIAPNIT